MSEERTNGQGGTAGDPERRAFTGGADMPPSQPDQPEQENEELLRKPDKGGDGAAEEPEGGGNPHGDYPSLPGYGG